MQDKFAQELGVYYERQQGAYGSLSSEELDEMGVEDLSKAIQIKKLAQTFLASQGEVDRVSRLPEVFEQEKVYQDTFRENYLKSDARRIVLAYKIQYSLNSIMREMVENHAAKYEHFRRARNLVWALLIQAVLNDGRIDQWLEDYGRSLTMQVDYSQALRQLASTRVWSVMRDVLSTPEAEEQISQGKYGVLRTKATYRRCVEAASNRFSWVKKSP